MVQQEGLDCLLCFQNRIAQIRVQYGEEPFTFICNKGDYEGLVETFRTFKPTYATNTKAKIEHVYGVKIKMKKGVQTGGYFFDKDEEKIDED